MVTIRETIHHGEFYNIQDSTYETIDVAFTVAVLSSPYNALTPVENKYRDQCLRDLHATGKGDLGWAHYEIIQEEA